MLSNLRSLQDVSLRDNSTHPAFQLGNYTFYPLQSRPPILDLFQERVEKDLILLKQSDQHSHQRWEGQFITTTGYKNLTIRATYIHIFPYQGNPLVVLKLKWKNCFMMVSFRVCFLPLQQKMYLWTVRWPQSFAHWQRYIKSVFHLPSDPLWPVLGLWVRAWGHG